MLNSTFAFCNNFVDLFIKLLYGICILANQDVHTIQL